jgi:hypothetical protein
MHKLILEVCDGKGDSIYEPVFLETLHDLPMGVKQAVEDFIDAHDGEIATPIVVTARAETDPATPCSPLVEASPAASHP